MTMRTCPYCGGKKLTLISCISSTQKMYWVDRECGYREITTYDQYYDYNRETLMDQEMEVLSRTEPRRQKYGQMIFGDNV
jgi:hypothetical protein